MRRDMRHELHRHAKAKRRLAFVPMANQRIRHQVVAQLFRIVPVRRCGTGARVPGHTKAHRRCGQQILQRRHGKLDRGGIAAGVADAPLATPPVACQFGQAVVPEIVEAVIRRQVDDQRVGAGGIERGHARGGVAVGQRQHHDVRTELRQVRGLGCAVAKVTTKIRELAIHALSGQRT